MENYARPEKLKKLIFRSSMNKLWLSLLTSKKAPLAPNRADEKSRFYFTMPRHQAKCALLYEIGELNFRTNKRAEALKTHGTTECVVPGCGQEDTLKHAQECFGYSTSYREDFSPIEWIEYLSQLDLERFNKYKTSLTGRK